MLSLTCEVYLAVVEESFPDAMVALGTLPMQLMKAIMHNIAP